MYALFYFCYGFVLEKKVIGLSTVPKTPAHRLYDGFDHIPTRKQVLVGHHFASIAGIAPIVGPALALCWGWVPALAWVWFGNVCIGAVHDYIALMVSLRHDGQSIHCAASDILGTRTGRCFHLVAFCLLIVLIGILAAFAGRIFQHNPAVASSFIWTTLSAILLGVFLYRIKNMRLLRATLLGILMLIGSIWLGTVLPISASYQTWLAVFFFYLITLSALPVHTILQPRDYLNSFLLCLGLLIGFLAAATTFAGISLPAFTRFAPVLAYGKPSPLWPLLPVIITSGALSGFHALVSSGTTSKQLSKESDGLLIGYGGMCLEGVLATIVIVAVGGFGYGVIENAAGTALSLAGDNGGMSFAAILDEFDLSVAVLFVESYTRMVGSSLLGFIPAAVVKLTAGLWVASFAVTTMDTANRIGRYCIEELTKGRRRRAPWMRTILSHRFLTSLIPAALGILFARWADLPLLWPAFGALNLCVAVFALLTAAAYLRGRPFSLLVSLPAWLMWITATAAFLWCGTVTTTAALGYSSPRVWIEPALFLLLLIVNLILLTDYILTAKGKGTEVER